MTRVIIPCLVVVAAVAAVVPVYLSVAGSRDMEAEHEAIVHRGATSCGVERWVVKTGIDSDAGRVNTKNVVPTNIIHLRSLSAPVQPPRTSRVAPTEFTVFKLTNTTLLRYKMEADSDFHLVLSDSGGRTMIAEIPAPACAGSSSPFIHQENYVRSTFTSRFHPTDRWTRGKWPVTISGVGFFDFRHGQSGVAPNAIELHPVLAVQYGSASVTGGPPPAPHPPVSAGPFSVRASVTPNPVAYGQYPILSATTKPGASCTASVVYSTGRAPRSFNGSAQPVGSRGTLSWRWHMESKGSSGTASVSCTYGGRTVTATSTFGIG